MLLVLSHELQLFPLVVVAFGGNPRGSHLLGRKSFPVEALEPVVILEFAYSFKETQSVLGLPTDEFVDEVSSLNGPVERNFLGLNLNLLGQDVISDLVLVGAVVRSASEHHFKYNHSQSKEVSCRPVGHPAHSLRGHVAGSPTALDYSLELI